MTLKRPLATVHPDLSGCSLEANLVSNFRIGLAEMMRRFGAASDGAEFEIRVPIPNLDFDSIFRKIENDSNFLPRLLGGELMGDGIDRSPTTVVIIVNRKQAEQILQRTLSRKRPGAGIRLGNLNPDIEKEAA